MVTDPKLGDFTTETSEVNANFFLYNQIFTSTKMTPMLAHPQTHEAQNFPALVKSQKRCGGGEGLAVPLVPRMCTNRCL